MEAVAGIVFSYQNCLIKIYENECQFILGYTFNNRRDQSNP